MKKLILLLLICLSSYGFLMGLSGSPVTTTCTSYYEETTDGDNGLAAARYTTLQYFGSRWNDSTQANDICRIDWYQAAYAGDITGKDLYFEIWPMTGDDLDTVTGILAQSDKVDGTNANTTWIQFDFSASAPIPQSTNYAIFLKILGDGDTATDAGTFDGTNYPSGYYDNGGNAGTKLVGVWQWDSSDGSLTTNDTTDDLYIKVYTDQ